MYLSTACPKWRLDRQALSSHLLYPLVNHAYANRYYHHIVRELVINITIGRYGFHIIISIQASDALIMKTRTGGRAVDRSIEHMALFGVETIRIQMNSQVMALSVHVT